MIDMQEAIDEVEHFLGQWQEEDVKTRFIELYKDLVAMPGVEIHFVSRPGVSYSLRPRHHGQRKRRLFAMVDVIDDDPDARWLSVCFYGDMITDPEQRGELVPGGLVGEDGYCFDILEDGPAMVDYLKARLAEACAKAKQY